MIDFGHHKELGGIGGRGPDLTSMIDMVFILLVFFLLTSVFILPSIKVDLPGAETGETSSNMEISVTLDGNGNLFVNKEPVDRAGLAARLAELKRAVGVKEIFVRADKELPFKEVIEVVDTIRLSGFPGVSFIVRSD